MNFSKNNLLCLILLLTLSRNTVSENMLRKVAPYTAQYYLAKFEAFKLKHGLSFPDAAEHAHRLKSYSANLDFIDAYNSDPDNTAILGETQWAHYTNAEFRKLTVRGYAAPSTSNNLENRRHLRVSTHYSLTATKAPTKGPTKAPLSTSQPTKSPTKSPSIAPVTHTPSSPPPTSLPTKTTEAPTAAPSFVPSLAPSFAPTLPPVAASSSSPHSAAPTAPSKAPLGQPSTKPTYAPTFVPPKAFDWTTQTVNGAPVVGPIKNQGDCGSCWAFAAVAVMESAYTIKYGVHSIYSEQEVISCDTAQYGCSGGNQAGVYNWVVSNGGLALESAYPYTSGTPSPANNYYGVTGTCVTSGYTNDPTIKPVGHGSVAALSTPALQAAVAQQPVAVGIDGSSSVFQLYVGGVITAGCGNVTDHSVVVVGYNSTAKVPYFKIRNSWGTSWGLGGYALISSKQSANTCNILKSNNYPTY